MLFQVQPRLLLTTFAVLHIADLYSTCQPQDLFCKAALQLIGPQPVLEHEVILFQAEEFAFPFAELPPAEIPLGAFLQLVKVPLNSSTLNLVYQQRLLMWLQNCMYS